MRLSNLLNYMTTGSYYARKRSMGKEMLSQVFFCPLGGGFCMMSLGVWLPGPMFFLGGVSIPCPCSFQGGVSASGGLPTGVWLDRPPPEPESGQYTSHWNLFLFYMSIGKYCDKNNSSSNSMNATRIQNGKTQISHYKFLISKHNRVISYKMPRLQGTPVAAPGFPRQGRQPLNLERKPIIWQDFCR